MPSPSSLRDSTQIVLPVTTLEGVAHDVETEFDVTVHEAGEAARIIGSPVAIKDVNDYLTRQGVALP
ncbi:hypothetical protein [Halobacterium zhouii]|uniref:VNG_1110C family protein n=1 Tax=Halobacterium zhouii TaxID=2902624 RepID=UPI001E54399F|nr:hypothetical protein [Halobacterium zhouii]